MKVRAIYLFLICLSAGSVLSGQETNYGPGGNTLLFYNPGYSGVSEEGTLRMSYLNFYPGHSYNFQTFLVSYDSYIPAIHGGAGIFISNDHLGGIVNDLRGGLSYSYLFQAGEDLYISAGLSASVFSRGFDFGKAVLPDQIDAMGFITLPTAESLVNNTKSALDVATGVVVMAGKWFGGFSVSHLAQPDISNSGTSADRLKRKFLLNAAGDYGFGKMDKFRFRPVGAIEVQGRYLSFCEGAVVETPVISFNSAFFETSSKTIDMQAGFSVRQGKFAFFYNYKFNLKSGSPLLPFSLVHQAGLNVALTNVEKRIKAQTIKVPQL
jgi:type IX secretion system PorP/SprF family membrane protein